MLMAETPWSYPVTCNSAGAVKTGQNAGILPVHPTVRFFLEAQQIIPLTAKVIHHL